MCPNAPKSTGTDTGEGSADGAGTIVIDLVTAPAPRFVFSHDGRVTSLGVRGSGGIVVVADGAAGRLVTDTTRPNSTAFVPTTDAAQ
jgi:hypothetical protein